MEAAGTIVVGKENSSNNNSNNSSSNSSSNNNNNNNSSNSSNSSTHTERQIRLQIGCSPTTNTFSPHSFLHLPSYSSLHIPNSSTKSYDHAVLSVSTVAWTWMCSDPRCPRGQRLDTLSLILSTLLLTETVPIQDPNRTSPHLEVKAWFNIVGLE
ncbi:hypothetical protein VZT92_007539 [Zoarces viviparus]|uniref:Uncharacterized protein n=1 Tax=Zoarces viviparus TaxID=48416 RepID=A0AAW1FK85_ZOAVI